MRINSKHIGLLLAALLLASCDKTTNQKSGEAINQSNLCQVSEWQVDATTAKCKPGQKIVFLPASFGNEQLPVIFAAINCDMRYSISQTHGGVACIFSPITPVVAKEAEPAK